MPVEIRELVIRTEISSVSGNAAGKAGSTEIRNVKKQILEECKRLIAEKTKRSVNKR